MAARAGLGRPDDTVIDLADVAGPDLAPTIYYIAMAAYFRNDFGAVETWLGAHLPGDPAMRARYLLLRGFAAAGKGNVAKQLELADAAIKLLRREAADEIYLLAHAAHVVAMLVRELPCEGIGNYLTALDTDLDWPQELEFIRFQLLRAMGWKSALLGAYDRAMTHLLRAAFFTDDSLLRAYAHLDRASVSIFAGERVSARSELFAALAIVDGTEWATVRNESILLLPYAAQVAAELDETTAAQRLCDLATELRSQISARWAFAHDGRMAAFLSEAEAFAYFDGDRVRALRAGAAAYETFAGIGYAWRAGRLAALLYAGTRESQWQERAQQWIAYYRGSPLERLLEADAIRPLSPRQRQVYKLMAQGKTGGEIAAQLGISTFTVRNHERLVMRAYGVHRRVDLLDKAR